MSIEIPQILTSKKNNNKTKRNSIIILVCVVMQYVCYEHRYVKFIMIHFRLLKIEHN